MSYTVKEGFKNTGFTYHLVGEKIVHDTKFTYQLVGGKSPVMAHDTDVGYDLELIKKVKIIRSGPWGELALFDTGVKVCPPEGFYFDMVARSSLPKTGYLLANNIGIIDPTYTGNLMAMLFKFDPEAPELELPGRYMQLILRPAIRFIPEEVVSLESTERGTGGFGSTGK